MNLYGKIIGLGFLQLPTQIYLNAIWEIDKSLKLGLVILRKRKPQLMKFLAQKS
jgi:hypothetical protein